MFDRFFFRRVLSLEPLVNYWRSLAAQDDQPLTDFARDVVARLDAVPALSEPIQDKDLLEEHRPLIELLMTVVFPMGLRDRTYAAAFVPFSMDYIYATPGFERLMETACQKGPHALSEEALEHSKIMHAYHLVLSEYYGVPMSFDVPMIFRVEGRTTGLDRFFRINVDPKFCTIAVHGDLPTLSADDLKQLAADPMNVQIWKEKLPPELFEFQGLVVMSAIEVTDQEVLSLLKRDLLQQDAMETPDHVDQLRDRLRALLRCPHLEIGLLSLEHGDPDALPRARAVGRSLLYSDGDMPACPHRQASAYAHVMDTREPLALGDLKHSSFETGLEAHLIDHGYRSFMLAPLVTEGRLIGLLEIASPIPGALNAVNALKLHEVMSLFATALRRSLDEREDRLQAVIKQQYTAVHPVVEWRFREAAGQYLRDQAESRRAKIQPIVFRNVYPIYGLSDVRNSSNQRNAAIQADLVEQLGLALSVIVEANRHRELPILDELGYRVERAVDELREELNSEHEISVLDFLHNDVEPLFTHLETFGPDVGKHVEAYREALDPSLGIVYCQRRAFDESIQRINDTISAYLDARQVEAQAMYPHYFEKYKTDGVDYNIYIGASLVRDGDFDPLYLHNLRLWQLMTTCGIEWELQRIAPELEVPLRATHLILVQNMPLSIRFRLEEKHFDVDGAYNIRYEIVKKRIDKAHTATGERLTQPGTISIVYSQLREVEEYYQYIDYLKAAGYLVGETEELDLEDLQGMTGLRALRVTVADPSPDAGDGLLTSDLLDEMAAQLPTFAPSAPAPEA